MPNNRQWGVVSLVLVLSFVGINVSLRGHEKSRQRFLESRRLAQARAAALAENPGQFDKDRKTCQLTIAVTDADTGKSLASLVRVTNPDNGRAIKLSHEIHRALNWYSLPATTTVTVPRTKVRLEAFHGIETEIRVHDIDLTNSKRAMVRLAVKRIYDPRALGLQNGNTHLHLGGITHAEAIRYLRVVPQTDGLDLVFLSHLRRLSDERGYISNQIVENSFQGGDLKRLSRDGVLFANGEEHRHNFGKGGEGYGHVMLLDLVKLIRPVSIGPGIMGGDETDGLPLQRGIKTARGDGATVVWCHNAFGMEDVPNWLAGLVHAQNIFDGGNRGDYDNTYYKYLNLGMSVPFSSGTDWFIYDFSRVYVPIQGELTSKKWLTSLQQGQSYITNGTFLEFSVDGHDIGDRISLSEPAELNVKGRGIGRNDFHALELVLNGKVIETIATRPSGRHFEAELQLEVVMDAPGWLALRIPPAAGKNEFSKVLFAHTSAVHVDVAGKRIFDPAIAKELIAEIEGNIKVILKKGKFADDTERKRVLSVHRAGIEMLQERLSQND